VGWVAGDGITVVSVDAAVMTDCIAAAGEEIIEATSRIWEKATQTQVFDGESAAGKCGELLILRRFPVTYPADAVTVSENGVSLVVAAGYSTSAGVIVKGAGLEDRCRLVRTTGAWAPGVQNITVGYTAGFTAIPTRIKYVAKELSWLYYQEGRKVGIDNVAQGGSSRGLAHKLSDLSRDILAQARRWAA
jgi:hypothetical protein